MACIARAISGCDPIDLPSTSSCISLMAVLNPAMVLKEYPRESISTKKSQIEFIGQTTGSAGCAAHQDIHTLRLEDIVREEFVSNADMNRLIVFSEKPFSSYRVQRFCTRGDSISGCVMGLAGEDELEQRDPAVSVLLGER